jgi:hypothetical protein
VGDSDQVLQRNKDFAATCAHEEAGIIARHQICVITCLDPRTDPSAFLDLDLGDAMVVGVGRTPAQVLLRWCVQRGVPVLSKSTHRDKIAENGRIFNFDLTGGERRNSMPSTGPAAPETLLNARGGEAPGR